MTGNGKLLLVVTKGRVNLPEFAELTVELGAADAMNLDGGGASGLYHKGKILVRPDLTMTNLLTVYQKRTAPHQHPLQPDG